MSNPVVTRKSWVVWIPAILWMSVIFAFSHHTNFETGLSLDFPLKKTSHAIEYALLALCFHLALAGSLKTWSFSKARWAWMLSVFYAVSDEIHQYFVPTRSARVLDILIDSLGALLALYGLFLVLRRYRRK